MDLEHPDIEHARRTGYPTKNTLTAMSASENINRGYYTISEVKNKMSLAQITYEGLNDTHKLYERLRNDFDVIGIVIDEFGFRVHLSSVNVFVNESEGNHVEIESAYGDDQIYNCRASFQVNNIEFFVILSEREKDQLEEFLNE